MLPGKDGFELVDEFVKRNIPVIFLTAKESTMDKVKGLKLGAEDYITKPFDPMELIARIEVVLRRSNKQNEVFKYKNLVIDFNERTVLMDGNEVELTTKEFDLLEVLIRNKNLALSREKLLEMVWNMNIQVILGLQINADTDYTFEEIISEYLFEIVDIKLSNQSNYETISIEMDNLINCYKKYMVSYVDNETNVTGFDIWNGNYSDYIGIENLEYYVDNYIDIQKEGGSSPYVLKK